MLYSLVKNMIALNSPVKPDLKKLSSYLEQVNNIGWYTNFGPLHQKLTERLEEYLGIKNLLLMSNGTLALQVAYEVLGVKSALTTPFSLWQHRPLHYGKTFHFHFLTLILKVTICVLRRLKRHWKETQK